MNAPEPQAGKVTVAPGDLTSPQAAGLIAALNAELMGRYPEEGANHFRLDPDELTPGRGAFLLAFRDGQVVGCGAIRRLQSGALAGAGEIKRMYVRPADRGRGVGQALLEALENEGRRLGVDRLVLETGDRQPEALALYRAGGFQTIPAFGEYVGSRLSVCMEKRLAPGR